MHASENIVLLASRLQTVRYVHVMNLALLASLFDYSLTLSAEISLMWHSKWAPSKILFFLSRYSPAFDVPVLLYYSMVSDISFTHCSQLFAASSWGTVFGIAVAEAILVLRTYALSGRKRSVFIIFTAFWAIGISASVVLIALFLSSVSYGPPPSPSIPGCFLVEGSDIYAGISFFIVLLNDTIIMAYTLWLGFTNYRHMNNPFIVTLYRDGVTYYLFLCAISAVNVAILLKERMPIAQICNALLRVLHSILSARILLHVRGTEYGESGGAETHSHRTVVLSFANSSEVS
ncbi:hypothetical protein GGX14DRAFT_562029 [Mycena pura]|uniref:DUF6533 domain-containing protein n=1 Tax=Mycena pura TaxID=153505 RepID=A0AAD6VLD0_9AGAR|nr:hypothetical protein GGX14DRAFT_562029 [Mycena pura]